MSEKKKAALRESGASEEAAFPSEARRGREKD